MSLERLWLQAWIDGLARIDPAAAVRPVEHPTGHVLLRDTDRAPYVPLRPAGRDRA